MARFKWPVTGTNRSNDIVKHTTLIKCDFDGVDDAAKFNISLSATPLPPGFETRIRKAIAEGLDEACSNGYCPTLSRIDKSIVRNLILKNVSTVAGLEARKYIPLAVFQGLHDSYDSLYDKIAPQKLRKKYKALRVKTSTHLPNKSTSLTTSSDEIISALGLVDAAEEHHTATSLVRIPKRTDTRKQKKKNKGVNEKDSEVHDAENVTGSNKGLEFRKDESGFITTVSLEIEHQSSVNKLEPMTTIDLLNNLASSLRIFLPAQKLSSRSVTISSAHLLDSGNVEIDLHSKTRKSLRKFDDAKGWDQDFEMTLVGLPVPTYKLIMHSVKVNSLDFQNRKEKAAIIRELAVANPAIGQSDGVETTIGDIYWDKDYSQKQMGCLIVEFLDSSQASQALERGIWWRGARHYCWRIEKHLKLIRCSKCQSHGHRSKKCSRPYQCGICAEQHQTATCKSNYVRCALCGGNHRAGSPGCPAKIEAKRRLRFTVETPSHEVHATSSQQAQHSGSALRTQPETFMPLPVSQSTTSIRDDIPESNASVPQAGPRRSTQSEIDALLKTVKDLRNDVLAQNANKQNSSKRPAGEAFAGGADAESSYKGVKRIKLEPRSRENSMAP